MLPPQLKNVLLTSSSLYSRGPTVLWGLGSEKQWFSKQIDSLIWVKSSWLTCCSSASAETPFLWTCSQDGFLHVASKSVLDSEKSLVSLSLKSTAAHDAARWSGLPSASQDDHPEHQQSAPLTHTDCWCYGFPSAMNNSHFTCNITWKQWTVAS